MPFVDLQTRLGIDADKWLLNQSSLQPKQKAARCHTFEKDWIECSHNIGQTRSKKECQLELEDFNECLHKKKTVSVSMLSVSCVSYFSIISER
ncbi:NADH dehydrogenase [ubiquinone] iron-sulfur protein 5 [Notothenia coriiceps]|uniref:NADH dehydrogenase [ubiquinone] iron-sulfur protein 5 n=1 Tax=Notothenia coriiceps TaxID=8208 RepID=A0A6I9NF18_9TELE|nr:PREDICTED: NADH dehydrogenase [ubiquinone] iron-sulfur protein 5 [Notothenia coriiceps]